MPSVRHGINSNSGNSDSDTSDQGGMMMETDADSLIQINAGTISVNADGDGLDSNGVLEINGGSVFVSGSVNDGNAALDYGTGAYVNGGTLIAVGYSGMAEQFSSESAQCSFLYGYGNTIEAGTEIILTKADGTVVVSYTVPKSGTCINISSPELEIGESYTLQIGDESVEIAITATTNSLGDTTGGMMPGGQGGFGNLGGFGGQDGFGGPGEFGGEEGFSDTMPDEQNGGGFGPGGRNGSFGPGGMDSTVQGND